jgi:hypothetical protein
VRVVISRVREWDDKTPLTQYRLTSADWRLLNLIYSQVFDPVPLVVLLLTPNVRIIFRFVRFRN